MSIAVAWCRSRENARRPVSLAPNTYPDMPYCGETNRGRIVPVKEAPNTGAQGRAEALPTQDEIVATFETLGLMGTGPTGYHYLSNWNAPQKGRVFEVVRTTTSARRGA
ncbi:MAG: hypothetical protein JWP75_3530 [Frondihabitans sp.]|nr:hypothetical protein [Frondihabitans sp.]